MCNTGGGSVYKLLPLYILASIAYAFSKYNPNIINADLYDADAYLMSIYNVSFGIPYTIDTTGIYGHYAIFFKFPMTLFGDDIIMISVLIAIVAGISMAAFCYAIENLIRSNAIKVLVILTVLLEPLYALPYSYYQTSPNRYLFPALIIALIVHNTKKININKLVTVWIGGVISALGLLWNLESGLATAVAWFIYLSGKELQKTHRINRRIAIYFLMIPLELISAIAIFVIYNIWCGGTPSISIFFYPFNHHLEDFALPIIWGNYAYLYVIPIFMSMFMWSCSNLKNKNAPVIGAISAVGVILFSYYMNRFAMCNAWMIMQELALLLGVLIDKSIVLIKQIVKEKACTIYDGVKSALAVFAVFILTTFSLGNIFSGGMQLALYQNGTKDVVSLKDWAREVESIVPKDTYAIGLGTNALYSLLGWDTGYHINDLPNIVARQGALDSLYSDLYNRKSLFITREGVDVDTVIANGGFSVSHEFTFGNKSYYYLTKQ